MKPWQPARSLEVLRLEINTRYPGRSIASDGMIGNPAHAATASDHNPNAAGVVCAFDITHDPAHGLDIGELFEELRAHPHPDAKYLIANRQIASRKTGWTVRAYTGDPHTSHLHVSVGVGPDGHSEPPYDDLDPWLTATPAPPTPAPPPRPSLPEELSMFLIVQHEGDWLFTATHPPSMVALGKVADPDLPRLEADDATWNRLVQLCGPGRVIT